MVCKHWDLTRIAKKSTLNTSPIRLGNLRYTVCAHALKNHTGTPIGVLGGGMVILKSQNRTK